MEHVSLLAAFAAGLLSFANPCVLPLVPGFLGYLSGVSVTAPGSRRKVFVNSVFFVFGFSFVFALLGVLLNSVLQAASAAFKIVLSRVGGVMIILFGLHVLKLLHIPFLEKEHKFGLRGGSKPSYAVSFFFGATFAVGWTPCVGALLASVLALAATSAGRSFVLLASYALGLGLPFLLVGLFSSEAIRLISRSGRFFKYFNLVVGAFLLLLGSLVFTGRLSALVSPGAGPKAATLAFSSKDSKVIGLEPGKDAVASMRASFKVKKYLRAKEFVSPDGFINAEPFPLQDLVGKKVILLDFWTYSCINCQRTFPYLKAWHERYKDEGLVIIGVHSPEFAFEKKYENVLAAVKKWGIPFAIVLDNDHKNLRSYDTVYWPTKYLIDIDGFIVYKHIGEGGYQETEQKIRQLLDERHRALADRKGSASEGLLGNLKEAVEVDFSKIGTPEIYFGSSMNRGHFGNPEGLRLGQTITYVLPGRFKANEVYIEGVWYNAVDHLELKSAKGRIVLAYKARAVNIVAGAAGEGARLRIRLDGKPLDARSRGRDVNADGIAEVRAFDLYNIVAADVYAAHTLEIEVEGAGFSAYAFTFG